VGIKESLRHLEEQAQGEMIIVPQQDGTVARFPTEDCMEALLALIDGRDHLLAEAVRDSSVPSWQASFYNALPIDRSKVPDLSE
jgi:hypothetical protein